MAGQHPVPLCTAPSGWLAAQCCALAWVMRMGDTKQRGIMVRPPLRPLCSGHTDG